MRQLLIAAIFCFLLLPFLAIGQIKDVEQTSSSITVQYSFSGTHKRLALVVGISEYQSPRISDLMSDANDVDSMANALKTVGFDVVPLKDATLDDIRKAVSLFSKTLLDGKYETALFYFTGHGAELSDVYLLPKDYEPIGNGELNDSSSKRYMKFKNYDKRAYKLSNYFNEIREIPLKYSLCILDACRSNPKAKSAEETEELIDDIIGSRARIENANNFIFYSTTYGNYATSTANGLSNSVFTHCVLKHIRTPGINLNEFVNKVAESCNYFHQSPTSTGLIPSDFYFVGRSFVDVTTEMVNYIETMMRRYEDNKDNQLIDRVVDSVQIEIKSYISKGANPNVVLTSGTTPLLFAIAGNSIDLVNMLIARGADVNYKYRNCVPPLYEACDENQYNIAKLLLENGAQPDAADIDGETALMTAFTNNNLSLCKLLLDWGANVNATDNEGQTVLDMKDITTTIVTDGIRQDFKPSQQIVQLIVNRGGRHSYKWLRENRN